MGIAADYQSQLNNFVRLARNPILVSRDGNRKASNSMREEWMREWVDDVDTAMNNIFTPDHQALIDWKTLKKIYDLRFKSANEVPLRELKPFVNAINIAIRALSTDDAIASMQDKVRRATLLSVLHEARQICEMLPPLNPISAMIISGCVLKVFGKLAHINLDSDKIKAWLILHQKTIESPEHFASTSQDVIEMIDSLEKEFLHRQSV